MQEPIPEFLADHAARIQKNPFAVADMTIRYGSSDGIELLALMASRGEQRFAEILEACKRHLAADHGDSIDELNATYDHRAIGALGLVMLSRPFGEPDVRTAADLFRFAYELGVHSTYTGEFVRLVLQSNLAVGHHTFVEQVLAEHAMDDEIRWMIRTDLVNPFINADPGDTAVWLKTFNELFVGAGLRPIALADGEGAPFDRLMTVPAESPQLAKSVDGSRPLVTVIMSVYSPDQSLRTAVMSIIDQTWQNLQILLIDDCSPPEFNDAIAEAATWDDRIELLRMEENGGTYRVRNFALTKARGEFVTFQDSDDWSHPERIERQILPLLEDADLISSRSSAVRLTPRLAANHVGYYPLRRNASSLMFRRSEVVDRLGSFDLVRKAADSEFISRMTTVFGEDAMLVVRQPLAIVQLTETSLSRGDFSFQWHAPTRAAYRESFEFWHKQIARGTSSARMVVGEPRRYPAAEEFISKAAILPAVADVLIVSDWREDIERYRGVDREVTALAQAGLRPYIAQAETPRYALRRREPKSDAILEAFENGSAVRVNWGHDIDAGLVVVRDPELLNFPRDARTSRVCARRLVIAAGFPCRTPETGWLAYDPAVIEDHARTLFGVEPEWLPAHEGIAESLRSGGALSAILRPKRLGVVQIRRKSFTGLRAGNRAVVGTTGLAFPPKDRPSFEQLLALMPDDDTYDVRIRAPKELIGEILGDNLSPPNWLVMEEADLAGFFGQLDFFVGVPMRSWGPELSWAALEAIANGAVAILDPSYKAQFGDAAVYAVADDVRGVIDALVKDSAAFGRQQSRGYDFCESQVSAKVFRDVVSSLVDVSDDNREREHA